MKMILITCKNKDCNSKFRVPEFARPNSTIKTKLDQECKRCKNADILKGYKNNREKKPTISRKKPSVNKTVKKTRPNKTKSDHPSKNRQKQNINKALNTAWSKLVKLEWENKCAVCGNRRSLNSHHIYSRAKKSVCWDTMNGICLCVKHHIGVEFSAHKTPNDFTFWLLDKKGKTWLMKLRIKSNSTSHYHEFEKEIMLKELNKRIKEYEIKSR